MIRFEWDPIKARTNRRKHGITFEEAVNVFDDPYALFEQDQTGDETGEVRWRAIGLVEGMVVVLVVHTVREEDEGEAIRLISARRAIRKERNRYEQTRAQDLG
jgi:uncharacterized DUF497 family protein